MAATKSIFMSIFITGAGSGMGRAGAEHFHARGWRVGATDRNADGLTSLAEELGPDRIWTHQVRRQRGRRPRHDVEQRGHR